MENTGIVEYPQPDTKADSNGMMAAILRTAPAEAVVEDTGGTKSGVGAVCVGHVMLIFLFPTAAAFVVVKLPQGSCSHIDTGLLSGGGAIVVVVGLAIESGGIAFEGNGRVFIISFIFDLVGVCRLDIEAVVVMMSLATGLDIDDYNYIADLGFDDVVSAAATADAFVVVPFNSIDTSAAKLLTMLSVWLTAARMALLPPAAATQAQGHVPVTAQAMEESVSMLFFVVVVAIAPTL